MELKKTFAAGFATIAIEAGLLAFEATPATATAAVATSTGLDDRDHNRLHVSDRPGDVYDCFLVGTFRRESAAA